MAAISRVLETVLTGRNLLSPMLATASRDVVAFNSTVATAQGKAATAATTSAGVQSGAASKIAASNVKASTSAQASAAVQARAHTTAAQSASLNARVQETANRSLAASNQLLGTSLTPLTAGLGAVGLGLAYAGYRGMEFDSAMSQVQAASQETGATLGQLSDLAIKAGADTQYSAVEAAQGITEMSKAGVASADIIGGGLVGALNLAASGQMEVADAAELGATAMNVFNLRGDQMSHVADLLAAGAGKAQGSVHDLGMALNQSALVAAATGLSIEETAGSLALFASQGLVGSDAGTSFRQMLLRLQNPSNEAMRAMDELGVSLYDANGEFAGMENLAQQLQVGLRGLTQAERDKAMATIFGSDAVRAANVLYEAGAKGVEQWTANVNDAGYAQRQATQLTDNLRGDLERLGGAFDSVMTTIGGGAQGALRELVQALTFIVQTGGDVLGFFTSLPGPVQGAVIGLAALAALRGPLGTLFTNLAVGITSTVTGMGMATGATTGLGIAAGTARIAVAGLVTAAAPLAAVIAAGYAVKEIIDFTNASDNAADSVESFGRTVEALPKATQLAAYREELQRLQDIVAANDEQNWFDRYIWQNPFDDNSEVREAREAIELIQGEIEALEAETESSMAGFAGSVGEAMGSAASSVVGAAQATVAQSEEASKALEEWLETLQGVAEGFVAPLEAYKGLLQEKETAERESAEATAASTESTSDSWKDYVGSVDVSLDELATRLEEQIANQQNWRTNIGLIAQWAGADVAQHLAAMGEEGVDLVAKMANGTDAEAQRMAALIREDIRLGSDGWAAEMDKGMQVMAAIGAAGAGATAAGIAQQLGLGVGEVMRIAEQYGLQLASGINPILAAVGKAQIGLAVARAAAFVPNFDQGGYTGPGHKYQPAGIVHAGEYVLTKEQTDRLGIQRIEDFANRGYATGGFVTPADVPRPPTAPFGWPVGAAADGTMGKGYDAVRDYMQAQAEATQGGTAGAGAIAGTGWQPIWNYVKARVPAARINSTYRPGDPGRHGRGLAVDFGYGSGPGGAGSAGLALIERVLHDGIGASLAELIYDGIGNSRPDLRLGRPHTYSKSTQKQHANHVHAAREQGGPVWPGANFLVGERGPEIARFDSPATVYPNGVIPAAMPGYGAASGGPGIDVDRLADRLARAVTARERPNITVATHPDERAIVRAIDQRERQQAALAAPWP